MQPGTTDIEYGEPFNKAFDQIRSGIDEAVGEFNQIVERLNDWRWLLGPVTVWWIKSNLDTVRGALDAVLDRVDNALEHQLPVLSLINISFRWVNDVKTPVSDLSFVTTEPVNENLAKWSGDASSAYQAKAGKQKAAVDETVLKAEFISQWLFKIAKANVDYAVQLAKIVTSLAGKLAQAASEAATVFALPWAVETLADSVGDLVQAGLDTLLTIGQRFVDAVGNVRDIATQVGDYSKLPGGKWPEAVRG
ncbi:hypothetical protein [Micromonospora coxensis]|uniref:Proteins of 100 residues with WXG n=1 Tax=Micromonospora coxensis TaxID=356852 RepID=A0A1C5GXH4_9ACTN|nr:hypothetical protein [Micromonospora coxensis]SCG38307.1 hypothetical protein GA0070614_0501 [Micromonospora coxensis]